MQDDDKKPEPTKEEVDAANKAEEAKWQGDFDDEDLRVPYKREENKDDTTTSTTDDKKPTDKQAGDTEDEEDATEQYSDPTPILTAEDPGEYQPGDYSFEVTLKDGKTVKVSTPEEADKLAEDPDNFETPKQLSDFIKKSTQMQIKLDRDREDYDKRKKTFTEQLESETQRRELVDSFANEFQYLESKGKLPKVDNKYRNADWSDPEVAKQPGVKEQIAVLRYMERENADRMKAKIKPITSIVDAYNAWIADEDTKAAEAERKKAEEAEKKAGEARRAAGARIAGTSPTQQGSYVPKGIAVGNPNVLKRGAAKWDD